MNYRRLILTALIISSLGIPTITGNMPSNMFDKGYQINGNGVTVENEYWVYGTVRNSFMTCSMQDIVVEVTLLDATGNELDALTTLVRQKIVEIGEKGSFLVKSSTQEEVAEIKFKVESYEETDNIHFKYLELSTIWTVDTGVTGWLENTHDTYYVNEAEVIATFLDADGNVMDIQSYGMNYYGKFESGEKKKWFCETDKPFESYFLNVQCNLASRERYMRLDIERPYQVIESWTPPIGETILLILKDDPHYGTDNVNVDITDPLGNSTTVQFVRSGLLDYRYEITPDIPGRWNVTWVTEPFWTDGGAALAEGAQMDTGFFTWDPDPDEDETDTPEDTSSSEAVNSTDPALDPIAPTTDDTIIDSSSSSASEIIDSASSAVENIVDELPEEVKNKIPGYPVFSIIAAFGVIYFLTSRNRRTH